MNPLPGVDFLTTISVNVQMIIEISKIYEVKITIEEAKDLSKSLVSTLAKLGILKGGVNIISSVLASSFTTIFISKSIQSITAVWLIRIVGLTLIEYFSNDKNWGEGGIQEVVDKIYSINKREEVLNNFIKEAIKKINSMEDNQTKRILPPYLQKD